MKAEKICNKVIYCFPPYTFSMSPH